MMDAQGMQYVLTAAAAFIAVVFGTRAFHRLFQGDAISDTFTDAHHEVYMFIIFGFILSALGEITWYLIFEQSGKDVLYAAMPDFYWVLGYVVTFLGVLYGSYRVIMDAKRDSFVVLLILAPVIAGIGIFYFLPMIGIGVGEDGAAMLMRFYPAMSFMILVVSAFLYYFADDEYYALLRPLLFIFMAMFIGDILFGVRGTEFDLVSTMANISYIIGYLMAAYMFYHKHAAIGNGAKK